MTEVGLRHILADPVSQVTQQAGEDLTNDVTKVEQRYRFTRIQNTTGVQTITTDFLHRVVVNTGAASATILLEDGSSSVPIGQIKMDGAVIPPVSLEYNIALDHIYLIVTPSSATLDLTIVHR
jgi:hypothetical protein